MHRTINDILRRVMKIFGFYCQEPEESIDFKIIYHYDQSASVKTVLFFFFCFCFVLFFYGYNSVRTLIDR